MALEPGSVCAYKCRHYKHCPNGEPCKDHMKATNKTTVINLRTDGGHCEIHLIGRITVFGNPFKIGPDGSRMDVIKKYYIYFYGRLAVDPAFKKEVHRLKGKTLGCWCKPLPCHGDIIAEYLNGLAEEG